MVNRTYQRLIWVLCLSMLAGAVSAAEGRIDRPSAWNKRSSALFSGQFPAVGDPSILKVGQKYHMFYTCFDAWRKPQGPAICHATSTDGDDWTNVKVDDRVEGRVLKTGKQWDTANETAFAMYRNGEFWLYFSGYMDNGSGSMKSFPAFLGLAKSTDGVKFTRVEPDPIMKPTPGGYDSDAIFSPTIIERGQKLYMVYTGHCWKNCTNTPGVTLLGATSTDGIKWTKQATPILTAQDVPWTVHGAGEAELVKGKDGQFYLFFTALQGDEPDEIGIARSSQPLGPYTVAPKPIVRPQDNGFDEKGSTAPSVLIEGDQVRMWFHGFSSRDKIKIGYASVAWPLFKP